MEGNFDMKKLISIALSLLMLISCFAISVSAAEVNYAQNENASYSYVSDAASHWFSNMSDNNCELLTDGKIPYSEVPSESVSIEGSNRIVTVVFDLGAVYSDVKTIKFCGVRDSNAFDGGNRSFSGEKTIIRVSQDGENFERNKDFEMTKENWSEDGSENGWYNFVFKFNKDVKAKKIELTFYSPTYVLVLGEIQILNYVPAPIEPEIPEESSSEEESSVEEVAKATVYFDNTSYNWENVYAYVYTEYDGENAGFPGLPMTKDEATGYYKMDLEGVFAQWGKIIFSENSGNAANRYPADLEPGLEIGGKDMIFGENASWTEYIPAVVEDPFDGKYFAISTSDGKVWVNVEDDVKLVSDDNDNKIFGKFVWKFELKEDGKYKIVNVGTGRTLDVDCGVDADGTNIRTWESNDLATQRYGVSILSDVSDLAGVPAYVVSIFPACSQTRAINADVENANVQMWTYDANNNNQKFVMMSIAEHIITKEINYAAGKKYTIVGPGEDGAPAYLGTPDDGTILTDGVLADNGKMGQLSFVGDDKLHTITIDLGAKRTDIDKLVFAGCRIMGNRQFANLTIEVSNNGKTYTTIDSQDFVQMFNMTEEPMYNVVVDFKKDIEARYVRIGCTNTEYVFSLSEIQVIGYDAEGGTVVNPGENENPGDAGFVVVALVAIISLAGAVIVSKRKFN